MQPTLRPGDRLLVVRWLPIRCGDVVVLRDPEAPSTFLLKRVTHRDASGNYLVHGDNPNVSRDSRRFGAVPSANVVGRVVYRYRPAHPRGLV